MSIFRDPTTKCPRDMDEQTVRTSMEPNELSGRKDNMPTDMQSKRNSVRSVANAN